MVSKKNERTPVMAVVNKCGEQEKLEDYIQLK